MSNNSSSQPILLNMLLTQIRERVTLLTRQQGVHTINYLRAAGFKYTGNRDTTRCEDCGLEISDWTADMIPFTIHSQRSPYCPFVLFTKTSLYSSTTAVRSTSVSNEQQNTSERPSVESVHPDNSSNDFVESVQLQQVRERTFSHWQHTPSSAQMIKAGFFNCNIKDRVICIYCNQVCQQWTPHVDDPCEVHKTLSPNCTYIKALLVRRGPTPTINDNNSLMRTAAGRPSLASNNINSFSISNSVRPTVQNNQSSYIDDQIQANYINTNAKKMVTCSFCKGAFRNLDSNDNPWIDHAQRFPHCSYIKQLQGTAMYRTQQGTSGSTGNLFTDTGQSLTSNEDILTKLVADRLNWPMSQTLLNRGYSLSIIKQCLEDQLRIKSEDFVSALDLKVACKILQKQVNNFNNGINMTTPSKSMRQWRKRATAAQAEVLAQIRATRGWPPPSQNQSVNLETISPCVVCLSERKVLAFLPCGHLVTCVPCGHSLNLCPVCRKTKEAVIRINTILN